MSDAELSKFEVLRDVDAERLPVRAAAGVLGLSERQAAIDIIKARYPDFGPTLAAEKLLELHDITVSRETLRAWMTDRQLEELGEVLASEEPLEAFWRFQSSSTQTPLGVEFLALANHRKAIADVLADSTNDARRAQTLRLTQAIGDLSVDPAVLPPIALATALVAAGRLLANEERVGIASGHAELRAFTTWALGKLSRPTGAEQALRDIEHVHDLELLDAGRSSQPT